MAAPFAWSHLRFWYFFESVGENENDESHAPELRGELRDELHALINLLQFQDITAQQLGYAGNVLMDIEDRMVQLAEVFDLRGLSVDGPAPLDAVEVEPASVAVDPTFDPGASHLDADRRQALADEIFR